MDVLVLTNMWPTPSNPTFGVFVQRRVDAYTRFGVEVRVVANTDTTKGTVALVRKYTKLMVRALWAAVTRRPDVIEAHYLVPTGLIGVMVGKVVRRPVVLVAHGSDVFGIEAGSATRLRTWVVRASAGVVANSHATAAAVRASFGDVPIAVVAPGTDLERFDGWSQPRDGGLRIAAAGSLVDYKGFDVLLEALDRLPDATVRLAGGGPERTRLETLSQRNRLAGRLELLGELAPNDIPALFEWADVVAVPSRREGFGIVAVEALAAGRPVVVADSGGLAEIPDETCGSVVPADDPGALAEALEWWGLRSRSVAMAAACRARAGDFSEEAMVTASLRFLRSAYSRAQ